jgi:hypothetical protein
MQTMKVKTELVHFIGTRCGVEFSQASRDLALHFGVDFRSFALPPELTKGLASERFDHDVEPFANVLLDVSYLLTSVKRWLQTVVGSFELP